MTATVVDPDTRRRRVWLLGRGRYIASNPAGWPHPDGGLWGCHAPWWWQCAERAIWRTSDGRTTGYYCGKHLPDHPAGDPAELCHTCGGPMDQALTALGETTHPTCED